MAKEGSSRFIDSSPFNLLSTFFGWLFSFHSQIPCKNALYSSILFHFYLYNVFFYMILHVEPSHFICNLFIFINIFYHFLFTLLLYDCLFVATNSSTRWICPPKMFHSWYSISFILVDLSNLSSYIHCHALHAHMNIPHGYVMYCACITWDFVIDN